MINKWEHVVLDYDTWLQVAPYPERIKGIIELIQQLKENPQFQNVEPGRSLGTLTLSLPSIETRIYVYYDYTTSLYNVYLSDHNGTRESVDVSSESIIETLITYIQKLK